MTIIEVNGEHESDEDGAAPLVLADTAFKREGFALFLKENGLEDKLQQLIDGGIETHNALRRYTPTLYRVGNGAQDEQDRQAHLELRRRERQSHSARGARDGASGQA